MNRLAQWKANQTYRAKQNLLEHIHKEIAPELEAMRKAQNLLDHCTRQAMGIESQGYVNAPGSSRLEIHTIRPCTQLSELTNDNEPMGACLLTGMDKGEDSTRNVATHNI